MNKNEYCNWTEKEKIEYFEKCVENRNKRYSNINDNEKKDRFFYKSAQTLRKEWEDELKMFPDIPNWNEREEAYRRGYCQGFLAAKRSVVSEREMYAWRNGTEKTCPPGSCYEGAFLHGLTNEDEHRFFLNKFKPKIEIK